MAYTGSFTNIGTTTATFTALFSGGDPTFIGYRVTRLIFIGGSTYDILSPSTGGSSTFTQKVTGLAPATTYDWTAQLGYVVAGAGIVWLPTYTNGKLTTLAGAVTPWSWTASNGAATAAQTQTAHQILLGQRTADDLHHSVWNDLVDKVSAMRTAKGLGWDAGAGYLPAAGCKVSAGEALSAAKYNSVRYNVGSVKGTGISDMAPGAEVKGYHVTKVVDVLNEIIAAL